MRNLGDLARQRITVWMAAHPKITQAKLAAEVGVSQTWVSQYKSGDQDADIDQLEAMARTFGHTVFELFDARPDPNENDLIETYRALPADKRGLARQALKAMLPDPPKARRGNGTR